MKRPQTKFHAHTMRESQVIRLKNTQNLSIGQNLSLCQNFIETATTDSDMLLQV